MLFKPAEARECLDARLDKELRSLNAHRAVISVSVDGCDASSGARLFSLVHMGVETDDTMRWPSLSPTSDWTFDILGCCN